MKSDPYYMYVEEPTTKVVVDLGDRASITIEIVNGKVEVSAKMSHGENASSWDEHEVVWTLPKYQK